MTSPSSKQCANCADLSDKNAKAIEMIQRLRKQFEADQQVKEEQAKRISELEATNEKMRNMLLAVKSHLAAQRDAERRRPPADGVASQLSPRISMPPASANRPPTPPPDPPGYDGNGTASTSTSGAHARPSDDKADAKSKKKFQRNTLPFIGALGALLDEAKDGAPTPPEEPPEEDGAADEVDDDYALTSRSPLDGAALGPDGQPIDSKVREILRLQDEVARQRRVRNAPAPSAQPTKSILKKSGEKEKNGGSNHSSAGEATKEKRSFFKFGSSSGLTRSGERLNKSDTASTTTNSGRAESTRRARVRFADSPGTREERLAQASLSQSAPAIPKETPPPKVPRGGPADESPPPSPPPADSSPVYRRAVATSTPKSKALDAAWRSIEQDLFD